MKLIHNFKFFLFLILISTFLSGDLYSQRDRTDRNPNRDNIGGQNDRPKNNDKTTNGDDDRKKHTGITIERPKRPDTDPIPPKRNPHAYDPPVNDPVVYNPPVYDPPIQQPEPPVIIEEHPIIIIYRPKEPEEPYDPIKTGLAKLDDLDYIGALADFNNAIEDDTSNYKLYYYRGLALLNLKDYIESIKDFNIYLKYFFYDMEGYFQRGLAKFYLREKINALEDFQTAAEMGHKMSAFIIKNFYDSI
jgi:tetratricopeptide (TPR) repeat protein